MAGSLSSSPDADGVEERSAFVHQELLKLIVLVVVAIVAFFVTRGIAASNRAATLRDAADWYERGRHALDANDATTAVAAFRRASVLKRGDRQYVLALARSLAVTRQLDAARSALLSLREATPDDPEINLELARLDASRQDVTGAVKYYHSALYAPFPADQTDGHRSIRLELIRFLIGHGQPGRAESELVALAGDMPDDPRMHVEVGDLFMRVGNSRRALDQYELALHQAPHDDTALAGAGRAAFAAGDYALAQRYLRSTTTSAADVLDTRAIVDLVLSEDPLAARIGSSARRTRLLRMLSHAEQRLAACVTPTGPSVVRFPDLLDEVRRVSADVNRGGTPDNDIIETVLDLVTRAERPVTGACPPPDHLDRALELIARRHGVTQP